MQTSRRQWIKSAVALSAGLPLGTALFNKALAMPASEAERQANFFINNNQKIRLGSNENPYGPSAKVKEAMMKSLGQTNRYAFQTSRELREVLAKKEGVTPDHILLGAGSSELLCLAGIQYSLEGGRILSAYPTFTMLMAYAESFKAVWDKVKLDETLTHDLEAMAAAVKPDTRLMFLCNPNNPTGTYLKPERLLAFCEDLCKRVPLYVDEAYLEFMEPAAQRSMVELVKKDANVMVARTFSKIHGLAGIRIGYMVAKPSIIQSLARLQYLTAPMSINQVAVAAAHVAIEDNAFQKMTRQKNKEAMNVLTSYFDSKKIFYGKSHTNCVFFPLSLDGKGLLGKMDDRNIIMRVWDYDHREWGRVSIGTLEEMKYFVKVFDEVV